MSGVDNRTVSIDELVRDSTITPEGKLVRLCHAPSRYIPMTDNDGRLLAMYVVFDGSRPEDGYVVGRIDGKEPGSEARAAAIKQAQESQQAVVVTGVYVPKKRSYLSVAGEIAIHDVMPRN